MTDVDLYSTDVFRAQVHQAHSTPLSFTLGQFGSNVVYSLIPRLALKPGNEAMVPTMVTTYYYDASCHVAAQVCHGVIHRL